MPSLPGLFLFYILAAGPALCAALGVQCSAGGAAVVHSPREPVGDERAQDEYPDQNGQA